MSQHQFRLRTAAALPLLLAIGACVTTPTDVSTTSGSVTHQQDDRVPEGTAWTQHYFPSSDGSDVELHSDVLVPEGLSAGATVPVILSVGPYFGHSGELKVENFEHTGHSDRSNDFIEGTDLFDRGYALVMVDLRGFGGSTGDNLGQDALKAVVAQEPSWDLRRNIRLSGVPRTTVVDIPRSYTEMAKLPQLPDDDEHYRANASWEDAHPETEGPYKSGYQSADPQSPYWKERDLAEQAKGSDTPLFVTQGFLESNSEPEAIEEYLVNHKGPERGWLGPWEHERRNDRDAEGRLEMGREAWFEETISFYDDHLIGVKPTNDYPAFAIQAAPAAGALRTPGRS